jgi:hypothetical protein
MWLRLIEQRQPEKPTSMKNLTKTALVAASVALALPSAKAATGDLRIGFNGGGTDYIADLGLYSTILSGGPNEDLSAPLATSGVTYSSSLNVGVVGGFTTGTLTKIPTLFATTLRLGGGNYTSAGSETAPDSVTSRNNMISAAGSANSLLSGSIASSDPTSWSSTISLAPSRDGSANNSFVNYLFSGGASGTVNPQDSPLANMGGSHIIVEDLWQNGYDTSGNPNGNWTYVGDLTIDLTGSQPTVTYDLAVVPEPGTYALIGVGGILFLGLRRKLAPKSA